MTSPETPVPADRPTISSEPLLRAVLVWGTVVGGVIALVAATIGWIVGGGEGAASGVIGAAVGIVFPGLTAVSIMIANRWYGHPTYLQIFFGIVLGGWVVKFILALVLMIVLVRVEWIHPLVFYFSLVAAAIASVVVELVVFARNRLPNVSDVEMPTTGDGV